MGSGSRGAALVPDALGREPPVTVEVIPHIYRLIQNVAGEGQGSDGLPD